MICTPAEVAAHAGRSTITPAEEAALTTQIALYQAELEGLLGRAVERAERTETWPGWTGAKVYASHGPVHGVVSVTVGGLPLTTSQYGWDRYGFEAPYSYYPSSTLVVVYDGGWDAPRNQPAKNAVMARTARWLNKRTDDDVGTKASAVEGHSVTWMDDGFTEGELRACDRLRAPDQAG